MRFIKALPLLIIIFLSASVSHAQPLRSMTWDNVQAFLDEYTRASVKNDYRAITQMIPQGFTYVNTRNERFNRDQFLANVRARINMFDYDMYDMQLNRLSVRPNHATATVNSTAWVTTQNGREVPRRIQIKETLRFYWAKTTNGWQLRSIRKLTMTEIANSQTVCVSPGK